MPISIPEYFVRFIDSSIDLNSTPKICCPFHSEDTPSFSYSFDKGVWRCFGACKFGGDVIALHQKNFKIKSRHDAEESLYQVLGLKRERRIGPREPGKVDANAVRHKSAYSRALMVATTPDDWVELDYIMGQYPVDSSRLEAFFDCRKR